MRKSARCLSFYGAIALIGTGAWGAQSRADAAWERTYAMTGTRSCVVAAAGGLGTDPDYVLSSTASTRSAHAQGTLVLRSDGTGSWETRNLQIYHQRTAVGNQPMNVGLNTCSAHFGSESDGSRWLQTSSCLSVIDAGAGVGTEATSTGVRYSLIPSLDGTVLFLSNVEPEIETVTMIGQAPTDRICGWSLTAILQQ